MVNNFNGWAKWSFLKLLDSPSGTRNSAKGNLQQSVVEKKYTYFVVQNSNDSPPLGWYGHQMFGYKP